jgi:hypothetical protein
MIAVACKPKPEGPQSPEIDYTEPAMLGMVIDQPFAATFDNGGNSGSMRRDAAYHMNHPEAQVAACSSTIIHEEWIRGETATFVNSATIQTPMASGIVAFADPEQAKAFAVERSGKLFTLDEMRAQVHIVEHP